VPLVSELVDAILNEATKDAPEAPEDTNVTHPEGTVGAVVLFLAAIINIKSPAWWLGIAIVVAWADADPIRLIAISTQTRPFTGPVPLVDNLAKSIVRIRALFSDCLSIDFKPQ
jgi:hypothetical protein